MIDYTLIRAKRRTVALYVRDGEAIVRAPLRMPKSRIDAFVLSKEKWVLEELRKSKIRAEQLANFELNYNDEILYRGKNYKITACVNNQNSVDDYAQRFFIPQDLSTEKIKATVIKIYRKLAKQHLTERLEHFQSLMGVSVTTFRISSAKKRWGSMSSKKGVSFSWLLIMADDDMIDYVVVHELAHIIEMNHSVQFWEIVQNILPDYKLRQAKLKELNHRTSTENWKV
ncbi:MAG: M48 family metallopeptidase [Oscillospiraceae bacterium]|nr:M48 family metallopeptidase [Oscillospiraceae bacterium]